MFNFNGIKDFIRRDKPENENDKSKSKKGTIILLVFIGIAAVNIIIQLFSGDSQTDTLEYIRENFHINPIDTGIMAAMLIILIIVKIKKNKK